MEDNCPEDYIHYDIRNFTDDEISAIMLDTQSVIFKLVFLPAISLFGMITNAAFLFVLARVSSMRTITNCYLGNLAVADFLHLFMSTMQQVLNRSFMGYLPGTWEFEVYQCIITSILIYWPYIASTGLVTLVSMERFIGICYPLKSRMMNTMSRTVKLIAAVWMLSFLSLCFQFPVNNYVAKYCFIWPEKYAHYTRLYRLCNSKPGFDTSITTLLINLSDIIPFILAVFANSFFYFKIIRALGKRSGTITAESNNSNQMNKVQKQVATMLVINGTVFLIAFLPYMVLQAIFFAESQNVHIGLSMNAQLLWASIASAILQINSAVNPVIYGATNPRYRDAFREAFELSVKKSESKLVTAVSAVSESQRDTAM